MDFHLATPHTLLRYGQSLTFWFVQLFRASGISDNSDMISISIIVEYYNQNIFFVDIYVRILYITKYYGQQFSSVIIFKRNSLIQYMNKLYVQPFMILENTNSRDLYYLPKKTFSRQYLMDLGNLLLFISLYSHLRYQFHFYSGSRCLGSVRAFAKTRFFKFEC